MSISRWQGLRAKARLNPFMRKRASGGAMGCEAQTAAPAGAMAKICNDADRPQPGCALPSSHPSRWRLLVMGSVLAALVACASAPRATSPGGSIDAVRPTGSATPDNPAYLWTFSTRLVGNNVVSPVRSQGYGQLDALLDARTGLLRWKLSFARLSGPVTQAAFHGPAAVGQNAPVQQAMPLPIRSPAEGRATLTAAQMADLRAGRWYVSLAIARYPQGELRGQLIERR